MKKNEPIPATLPPWLRYADARGVVLCARVRLARNVAGHAFPGWAGGEEMVALGRELEEKVGALPVFRGGKLYRMAETGPLDRLWLRERQLISADLAGRGEGSAVWISADETVSVMINEEDHLRIQVFGSADEWKKLWAIADAVETALGEQVPFAFSNSLGFHTACPTNVGTGLRVSVLMRLPGLILQEQMKQVLNALMRVDLASRGFLGEGTDIVGHMVQVSNQITWGRTEQEILRDFETVVEELAEKERWARERLIEEKERLKVADHVIRAAALLSHALLLSTEEALHHLSLLQLAREYDWLERLSREALLELYALALPGHFQKLVGQEMEPRERERLCADRFRCRLKALDLLHSLVQRH